MSIRHSLLAGLSVFLFCQCQTYKPDFAGTTAPSEQSPQMTPPAEAETRPFLLPTQAPGSLYLMLLPGRPETNR
jgi:hypothetical protein